MRFAYRFQNLDYLEVKNLLRAVQEQFKSSQTGTASYHIKVISKSAQTVITEGMFQVVSCS